MTFIAPKHVGTLFYPYIIWVNCISYLIKQEGSTSSLIVLFVCFKPVICLQKAFADNFNHCPWELLIHTIGGYYHLKWNKIYHILHLLQCIVNSSSYYYTKVPFRMFIVLWWKDLTFIMQIHTDRGHWSHRSWGSFRSMTTPRFSWSVWTMYWSTRCLVIVVIIIFCVTITNALTIFIGAPHTTSLMSPTSVASVTSSSSWGLVVPKYHRLNPRYLFFIIGEWEISKICNEDQVSLSMEAEATNHP